MEQQDERRTHAVCRDTGQEQTERRYASLMSRGDDDEDKHERSACERAGPYTGYSKGQVPSKQNRDDRAKRSAGRYAQRVWSGQPVSQHGLKNTPPESQRGAGEQSEKSPRQAQLNEDRPVRFFPVPDSHQVERC